MHTNAKLALALVTLASGPAAAAPARTSANEQAEAYIRRGVELRRKPDEGGALQEFRRAYELAPSPRAAAQMGMAEAKLKNWVDAEKHLAESLRARTDPWIKQNRAVLEELWQKVIGRVG